MSLVLNLAFLPARLFEPKVTLLGVRLWSRCALWGMRVFAGLKYEVHGKDNIPQGVCLVASQHQTMWETMALNLLFPDSAPVVKEELRRVPLYGGFLESMGAIFIDRRTAVSALKTLLDGARTAVAGGRTVVIYPEGTRRPFGAAPSYKPGVSAAYESLGIPCVPVAHNSGLYWPGSGFRLKPGTVRVEILPPIPPGLPREAFNAALRKTLAEATARIRDGLA